MGDDIDETSEFGQGFTYCIGLFLMHAERFEITKKRMGKLGMGWDARTWFNASSDHLYDIKIPKTISSDLTHRIETFKERVLTWGHGLQRHKGATVEDVNWSIREAKDILMAIDTEYGVVVIQGGYE